MKTAVSGCTTVKLAQACAERMQLRDGMTQVGTSSQVCLIYLAMMLPV